MTSWDPCCAAVESSVQHSSCFLVGTNMVTKLLGRLHTETSNSAYRILPIQKMRKQVVELFNLFVVRAILYDDYMPNNDLIRWDDLTQENRIIAENWINNQEKYKQLHTVALSADKTDYLESSVVF